MARASIVCLRIVPPEIADAAEPELDGARRCLVASVPESGGSVFGLLEAIVARHGFEIDRVVAPTDLFASVRGIRVTLHVREAPSGESLVAAVVRIPPRRRLAGSAATSRARGTLARVARDLLPRPTRASGRPHPPREHRPLYRLLRGDLQNASVAVGLLRAACERTRDADLATRLWRGLLESRRAAAFLRERLEALGGSPEPDLGGAEFFGSLYGATTARLGTRMLRLAVRGVANLAAECYVDRAEIFRERGEHRSARRFEELIEESTRLARELA